jgi:hypothetical protein
MPPGVVVQTAHGKRLDDAVPPESTLNQLSNRNKSATKVHNEPWRIVSLAGLVSPRARLDHVATTLLIAVPRAH